MTPKQQGLDPDLLIAPDFILVRMALVDTVGWNAAIVLQRIAFRCEVHPDGWSATVEDICRETRLKPSVVKAAIKLLRTRGYLDSRRASTWDSTQVWRIIVATPTAPEKGTDTVHNRRSSREVEIRPPEESKSDVCQKSDSDSPLLSKELEESSSVGSSTTKDSGPRLEEDSRTERTLSFVERASACFMARDHAPIVSAPARADLDRQAAKAAAVGLDPDLLIKAALKADSPSGWLVSVGMPGLLASRSVPSVTGGPAETPSPAPYDQTDDRDRRAAIQAENARLDAIVASLPPAAKDQLSEAAHDRETGVRADVARRQAVRAATAAFPDLDPTAAIESWLRASRQRAGGGRGAC